MEKRGNIRRLNRVVLVPGPFQGHINPMLQLGSILHSNGFFITVVQAQYNSPKPSSHPDFSFLPLPDTSSSATTTGEIIDFALQLNTDCKARFQECLAQVMRQLGPYDGIACIIYDQLMYFPEAAAKDLKLPCIVFQSGSAAVSLACDALFQLKAEGHIPFPESMSNDPVLELYPLRFKDLPILQEKLENFWQLPSKTNNIRTSLAIIYDTVDCLENSLLAKIQQQCQVPTFPIGPLHRISSGPSSSLLEEDTSCLSWLDKQSCNSVIYVSLGSIASMDVKELVEMGWGLVNSQQPFLWVVRPGSILGAEWIEVLPEGLKKNIGERGYIVKWAPQKEVLAHGAVGGFLSHCGWNSTLESICEGIPMICRPCFGDQKVNARYVSHVWRVGLELEGDLERGEIEKVVKKLMIDEEGEAMREKAKKLKENVKLCIKEGGSSYNSINRLVEMIRSF
ncbi:UDP-glycosyltransferase 76E4-like [Corylus avellana]|uniref:UDP-glycosyltransferase 76E4-like n=1 Tax=Corylus avellana TaxID=13451 RepID=UPI00286ACDA7|nr:UDP-glycosyltransferase 76E4-like [Corylus avellana]